MMRRFELGPILVALGAIALLVSLFLDWYGGLTAWDAFEVVEVLLAALAIAALVVAVGQIAPDLDYADRRWLSAIVLGALLLVVAVLVDPPPIASGEDYGAGAWIAFAAVLVMGVGTVLTLGRVRFAVSVEGRPARERVPVVDNRQDTTETAAVSVDGEGTTATREGDARAS